MKYLPQLDGIRGLAIIFVLIGHWSAPPIKDFLPWGNIGVYTFFVLSGYLITNILLEQKTKANVMASLTNFWTKRVLRIFPIYYLTLLILCLIDHQPVSGFAIWHFTYLSNFLFISSPQLMENTTAHLWSLAVEAQFYLFWPIIVFLLKDRYLLLITLFFLIVSPFSRIVLFFLMGWSVPVIKVFTLSSLDFLGMGALIALVQTNKNLLLCNFKPENLLRICFPVAITIFIFLEILRHAGRVNVFSYVLSTSSLVICLGYLISSASYGIQKHLQKIWENKILIFIGTISYGIYLYHLFIAFYVEQIFPNLTLDKLNQSGLRFIVFSITTFVTAVISWFLVEKPLLNLKKYIVIRSNS